MNDRQIYEIGQRVKHLRTNKHLTQEKFAEAIDVTAKHVSSVETGKACLSIDKMIEISDFFDCSLDYLVKGCDTNDINAKIPPTILEILSSNDEKEIATLISFLEMYSVLRNKK